MARILIVEDDPSLAEALTYVLGLEGHQVAMTHSADEGLRRGLAKRPDVVVAAWRLKGDTHGGEVCRRIHAVWPDTKAIIITAHRECVFEAAAYCACVKAVIEKPFHKTDILGALSRALGSGTSMPLGFALGSCFQDTAVRAAT